MTTIRTRSIAAVVALVSLVATMAVVVGTPASAGGSDGTVRSATAPQPAATPEAASAFVAVDPCRLFDSRSSGTPIEADTTTEVQVTGRCSTPGTAAAAAVTITVTAPVSAGFLTAWGAGGRPSTSNVNVRDGQTVANSSIVPLDADGRLRFNADVTAHVIVDVAGVFVERPTSRSGRYVPMTPLRIADTRDRDTSPLPATTEVVALPTGVPDDAVAVAATVTVVDARRDGFVSANPAGSDRIDTSISNLVAGETRAASAIVPVSSDGLEVHLDTGGHLLVDVTGWFTGVWAETDADGLFVPVDPVRLHDSRSPRRTVDADGSREIDVPEPGAAWALNVTATDVRDDGFLTVHPARTPRPDTSVVNTSVGVSSSNSAIVPVTEHGLTVASSSVTEVVVDGTGWFTGTPTAATTGPAPDPVAPARVLVVGDSAAAGMRWNPGATEALRGADFTLDLESCRRLVRASCRGRDGYQPISALPAVERRAHGEFDTLVVATGYNDVFSDLDPALDRITEAARARGMNSIVWLTLREDVGYQLPSGASRSYAAMNQRLRERSDELGIEIFDWWAYTADAPQWFASDGVHQRTAGSIGLADALSRALAALDGRSCPVPWTPGDRPETPCPTPDLLPGQRGGVPDVAALYP